ncbi:hypothetical protein D9619_003328 [Psilocybe cf. subviscida]|uniref:ferroxidase n=1 Tax=Psilocybe cf. subviscida TaxID=2480587 RepID=A0A8H5ETK0_9AGAR|nr:hypothetical protein D9619_003328 [Psilocybe cf. subviscida]
MIPALGPFSALQISMLVQTFRSLARCSVASLRTATKSHPQAIWTAQSHTASTSRHVARHLRFRPYSTPPPQTNESHLSMEEYHDIADKTMTDLLDTLEDTLDSGSEDPSYEVDYHSGVLTLKLGSNGTYVINKQPPNKQIWLSSPKSGPKRYDYQEETGQWVYSRDGHSMDNLLSEELSNIFSQPIQIRV